MPGTVAVITYVIVYLAVTAPTWLPYLVVAIVSFAVQYALRPDLGDFGLSDKTKDRLRNVRQPLSPHRVIYGKTRVGGTITYLHTTDDDEELHQLITVAGHPIDAIESIYGDDNLLQFDSDSLVNNDDAKDDDGNVIDKASKWTDHMYVWSADGTTNGDSDLLDAMVEHTDGSWTTSHKQESLAKVYCRFMYDRDAYASSLPNITLIVRGKKVYDPRDSRTVFTPSPYNVDTAINSLIDEVSFILLGQVGDQVLNDLLTETDGDYERGDVNNDDSITADDKTALENYLSTSETEPSEDEVSWIATKLIAHMRSNTKYSVYFSESIYSNNSALCILDYIKDTRYGLGEPESNIDIASFTTAANISDEFVQLKDYALIDAVDIEDGKEYIITTVGTTDFTEYGASANTLNTIFTASFEDEEVGSGTGVVALSEFVEKRYVCNGTFETSEKPSRILKDLLSTCSGRLTYQGGKWVLRVGAYVSPTITLTEDDIEGTLEVISQVGRRNLFNQVQSIYTSPQDLYQPTDAPLIKNATYLEQDNNEVITRDMEFPFTTAASTSQRLAKIELEQVRQQITVVTTFSLKKGMQIQAGDTIGMTNERMGWVNKSFIVEEWGMNHSDDDENPRLIVGVALREIASDVFDWNSGEETTVDAAPNTNLPDPFNVRQPTGLSVAEELYYSSGGATGSGAKVRAIVSWASAGKFVHEYELQYKKSSSADWLFATLAKNSPAPVSDLDADNYDFRVRGTTSIGSRSAWTETSSSLAGLTTPPADMTGFSVRALDGSAYLSWTAVEDLDVIHGGYIRVRHSNVTIGATWDSGVDVGKKLGGNVTDVVLPLIVGTYLIKAVDSTDNFSVNAVASITTVKNVNLFNVVTSLDEAADGFLGFKEEMEVTGLNLHLGKAPYFILFEDDSRYELSSGAMLEREVSDSGRADSYGTYEFHNHIDLGQVYTSRVYSEFETSSFQVGDLFDDRGVISDEKTWINGWGLFDGQPSDKVTAELQMRMTDDHPSEYPITPYGTVYHSVDESKFGASSIRFWQNSSNGERGRLTATSNSSDKFDIGSGDFTMEAWFKPHYGSGYAGWGEGNGAVGGSQVTTEIFRHGGMYTGGYGFQVFYDKDYIYLRHNTLADENTLVELTSSYHGLYRDNWAHIAVVRESGTVIFYVNGLAKGTGTYSDAIEDSLDVVLCHANSFVGYVDEWRYSNSVRYSSSFTPSTSIFSTDTNTLVLVHSDYPLASTTSTIFTNSISLATWTEWQKLLIGDFRARAFSFRVVAESADTQYNISISKLKAIVDMPDRVERAHNITSGISTYSVTYAQEYYTTPTVGITANGLGSSGHYVISNSTRTGFDINFYSGSGTGTPASANFNYQSIGY